MPDASFHELVLYLAQKLVDHPDAVQVSEFDDAGTEVFELRVHPDDLGRIIGRQGRTAQALRALLQTAASKQRRRAALEILDE